VLTLPSLSLSSLIIITINLLANIFVMVNGAQHNNNIEEQPHLKYFNACSRLLYTQGLDNIVERVEEHMAKNSANIKPINFTELFQVILYDNRIIERNNVQSKPSIVNHKRINTDNENKNTSTDTQRQNIVLAIIICVTAAIVALYVNHRSMRELVHSVKSELAQLQHEFALVKQENMNLQQALNKQAKEYLNNQEEMFKELTSSINKHATNEMQIYKSQVEKQLSTLVEQLKSQTSKIQVIESTLETMKQEHQAPLLKAQQEQQLIKERAINAAKELRLADVIISTIEQVQALDLSDGKVNDEKKLALLHDVLHSTLNLTELKLSQNTIDDNGIKTLVPVLEKLTQLQELWLGSNKITDNGVEALVPALKKLTQLKRLDLDYNRITDSGIQQLVPALEQLTHLHTLVLRGNQITDSGIKSLIPVLEKLRQLNNLSLYSNAISEEQKAELRKKLSHVTYMYL